MSTSLCFKIKDNVDMDKYVLLEIFFKSWIDDAYDNQVRYKVDKEFTKEWEPGMVRFKETFRVEFENQEDAPVMRLRGVPEQFQTYLELEQ